MSRLDALIAELCPDGVEFDTLGLVCEILDNQRKPIAKKDRKAGIYPYYGANGIQDYVDDYLFDGTFLLMGEDGSVINKENRPVLTFATGKIWVNNHAHVLSETPRALLRFVYHYLQTMDVSPIVRGTPPKINQQSLRNIIIPLPPLPVQQEIVRILDNFTGLIAELMEELTARRKQYEYYKDLLLMFGDDVPRVSLGDICTVRSGGTPLKAKHEYWDNGTIKWLGSTVCQNHKTVDEVTNYICELGLKNSSAKRMKRGTTLIALVGATIGKVAFLPFEATINQNIAGIYPMDTSRINPSYVFYACSMLYSDFIGLSQGKLAMANLSFVRGLKIPAPPLEEQERIVAILDRFDVLCNDPTSGLPAEIEARQKQYEYYRDKLLSFKEVTA